MTEDLSIEKTFNIGTFSHQSGKLMDAERCYAAILKVQPDHLGANHNMGLLLADLGKVKEAVPFLKKALQNNPLDAKIAKSLIEAHIALNQPNEAEIEFFKALMATPVNDKMAEIELCLLTSLPNKDNFTSRVIDLISGLKDKGQLVRAITILENLKSNHKNEIKFINLLSHCALLNGDLDKASGYVSVAQKLNPDNQTMNLNRARLLLKKRNFKEAADIAKQLLISQPNDEEIIVVFAVCLMALNENKESLTLLNKAINLNPNYAEAYINRGFLMLVTGEKLKGLNDFETAYRLKPHVRQIWDRLIDLKIEYKKFSEVIILLNEILEFDENNEKYISLIGVCYQKTEDYENAIKYYRRSLDINPEQVHTLNNLGMSLKEIGELDASIDCYNLAIKLEPSSAMLNNNLGVALQLMGNLSKAIHHFNLAAEITPSYEVYKNLGESYFKQEEYINAKAACEQALLLKPNSDKLRLSQTLQMLGEFESAISVLVLKVKKDKNIPYHFSKRFLS